MKRLVLILSSLMAVSCSHLSSNDTASSNTAPSTDTTTSTGFPPSLDNPDLIKELTQCTSPNPRAALFSRSLKSEAVIVEKTSAQRMQDNQVKAVWGKDGYIESSKHRYIKYLDSFKTRADIHFDTGKIYISTIDNQDTLEKLQQAVVQITLMPPNPEHIDLLGSDAIKLSNTPFFLGQILDQDNKQISTEEAAKKYADYLIANQLQEKNFVFGSAKYVEIELAKNHEEIREYQFSEHVQAAAKKYNIREDLIYAVMKTESSFNPYAISHAGAIGLMQIVPTTAGADVFNLIKGIDGIPDRDYLFDPANNIDTGVAYLSILKERYLKSVDNKASQHFAMISAYNGGTGNVLATFDNDRGVAMDRLNETTAPQVYCILTNHHPKEESRNYLNKVIKAQRNFNINEI